jgi:hypothetical protein
MHLMMHIQAILNDCIARLRCDVFVMRLYMHSVSFGSRSVSLHDPPDRSTSLLRFMRSVGLLPRAIPFEKKRVSIKPGENPHIWTTGPFLHDKQIRPQYEQSQTSQCSRRLATTSLPASLHVFALAMATGISPATYNATTSAPHPLANETPPTHLFKARRHCPPGVWDRYCWRTRCLSPQMDIRSDCPQFAARFPGPGRQTLQEQTTRGL